MDVSVLPVTPRTLLRWHRDLVRRKWTYRKARILPRPDGSALRSTGAPGPAWAGRHRRRGPTTLLAAFQRAGLVRLLHLPRSGETVQS